MPTKKILLGIICTLSLFSADFALAQEDIIDSAIELIDEADELTGLSLGDTIDEATDIYDEAADVYDSFSEELDSLTDYSDVFDYDALLEEYGLTMEDIESMEPAERSLLPLGDSEDYGLTDVLDQTHADQDSFSEITNIDDPGIRGLVYLLLWIYDLGRYLIGAVVLLLGSIAVYRLVTANGKEEDISRAKRFFIWSILGMIIFSLSWPLKDVFLIQGGNFFLEGDQISNTVSVFSDIFYYILQFFRYLLGGIAAYFITASGLKLVTYSESEEVVQQQKKVFLWGLIGLILFMISNEVVATIYGYRTASGDTVISPDSLSGIDLIIGISEFLLYFVGALALLAIVVSSVIYITSGENESAKESSKKIIIGSITGIVIAYASYTIVAEITSAIS